jgi:tetratricopeptide (TPR) repeat protein
MSSLSEAAKAVFLGAVDITSPPERSAYLDKACEGNAELRARVEALLKDHDEAGDFLEKTPLGQDATLEPPLLTEGPGTVVGRYKLLEQIGEGGMGVVFMAEQEEPIRRQVALKIIKPGMDTRQVIARFEAERQALALMDHPNIARVLDAGATRTGRPYFIMELAKGVPLTEYCDANRLSTPERLALFIEVCHAVQHAHQKGIIHRDLKPSNVLVTLHDGKPVPKIIDFGIAKATSQRLTEKTMFTSYGQMIGTPAYMSPEQAEMGGLDVDTRSDIYALGVLLYELLTGTTPFDEKHLRTAGYQEIQRIIREVEPLKPSTRLGTLKDTLASVAAQRHTEPARLARLVRGDLDWIVMKTLEKDRARRYETADGLILDIQHHLAHEPVLAGPPGAAYRARKFLRRHRTGAVAGLLVFLALAAGLAGTTVGLLRARDSARAAEQEANRATQEAARATQEADRATQEAAKAEAVTRFFQETLEAIDPESARGREVTVREVFDKAAKDIGTKFAGQPLVEAAVRGTLGTTYLALGDHAAAHSQLSSAFGIRRQILGEEHPDTLKSMMNLATALRVQGKSAQAEQMYRQVLEVQERVRGKEHPDTLKSMMSLASTPNTRGKHAEAEQMHRQVLEVQERVLGKEHPNTLANMMNLANALHVQGKYAEAEQMHRQVLEVEERVLGKEHLQTLIGMTNLANTLNARGKAAEAEQMHRQVLEVQERVRGKEHPDTLLSMNNLASALRMQGKYAQAEQGFRRVIEIAEKMAADLPSETNYRVPLVRSLSSLGRVLREDGRPQEAARYILKALDAAEQFAADSPGNAFHDQALAVAHDGAHHAWSLATSAEPASREPELAAVLATRAVRSYPESACCWQALGAANYRLGNYQVAVENLEKSTELQKDGGDAGQWFFLAMAHGRLGHSDAARQGFDRGVRWMQGRRNRDEIPRRLWAEAAALLGIAYPPPLKPVTPEVRAAWQGEMQRRARAIKATVVEQGQQVPVDVLPEALWRYTQPEKQEGSLWACGRTGRPVALVGMEFYQGLYGGVWGAYEFVSLSSGPVTAAGEGDWKWSPKKPGAEFKRLPDGPAPAEDVAGRLGHMKELLRRFTASRKPLPGKELVLLEAPVHRYADAERGLLDGAVFVFANGTDPEVILLLELQRADKASPPQWQYALARMSAAELWVNLDGTEVWRRPGGKMKPEDEYAVFGAPYLPK